MSEFAGYAGITLIFCGMIYHAIGFTTAGLSMMGVGAILFLIGIISPKD